MRYINLLTYLLTYLLITYFTLLSSSWLPRDGR